MSSVDFALHLQRHARCAPQAVDARTLRAALEAAFAAAPALRDRALDEHDAVRRHVAALVDGELMQDGTRLDRSVRHRISFTSTGAATPACDSSTCTHA